MVYSKQRDLVKPCRWDNRYEQDVPYWLPLSALGAVMFLLPAVPTDRQTLSITFSHLLHGCLVLLLRADVGFYVQLQDKHFRVGLNIDPNTVTEITSSFVNTQFRTRVFLSLVLVIALLNRSLCNLMVQQFCRVSCLPVADLHLLRTK